MVDYTQGSGKEYHIGVSSEDVGQYVILTGNPDRVKFIANFLDKPEKKGQNREFTTYTGFLNNMPVSVVSTGIGGPSTAICVEELIHLGCHTFIRVGTCGGMHLDVQGGDIVIASGAIRQEGTSLEYAPFEFPAVPNFEVLSAQVECAKKSGIPYHVGVVQCKDSFYGQHDPDTMPIAKKLNERWEMYCKLDTLCSEMESSILFIVGQARHVRTGAMFQCLANQERAKAGLENRQYHDLTNLVQTAIDTMEMIIIEDLKKG